MAHWGEKITEWADGRCAAEDAERIQRHFEACPECRDEAHAERLTRARLQALHDPIPEPTFLIRLAAMGGPSGPMAPRSGRVPGTPRIEPVASPRAVARLRAGSVRPPRRPDGMGPAGFSPRPGSLVHSARRRVMSRRNAAMLGAITLVGAGIGVGLVGVGRTGSPGFSVMNIAPAFVSWLTPDPSASVSQTPSAPPALTPINAQMTSDDPTAQP